jgi:hypothetical protein
MDQRRVALNVLQVGVHIRVQAQLLHGGTEATAAGVDQHRLKSNG